MKDNQKGLGLVKGLLIVLVIVGILGFVGWYARQPKSDTSETDSTASCATPAPTTNSQSFQLPTDWEWYEIKEIGVKYAYPTSWGTATTQTNSDTRQQYEASFTNSLGANTVVILNPDCSEFDSTLSDINNGKFDTLSGPTITKAIKYSQSSYSSLSHWSSDSGNQYKFLTNTRVDVGSIKSIIVGYSIVSGSEVCPDDRLASSDQPACITQSISDEVNKIISSLQKF